MIAHSYFAGIPWRLRMRHIWTRAPDSPLSYLGRVSLLIGTACLLTGLLVFSLGSLCPLWIVLPDGRVIECK